MNTDLVARLQKQWPADTVYSVCNQDRLEAAGEICRLAAELALTERKLSDAHHRLWMMTNQVTTTELKLAEKHCEWIAFKHAFNAVMKTRRAELEK